LVQITPHPDSPLCLPPDDFKPSKYIAEAIQSLRVPFVTVDFKLRSDGEWRIIEMGDGQVSGFPSVTSPVLVLSALKGEPL
jgi:hypothetical protein